ncbi:hypothetical protein B0I28_11095 [Glycomyces artemisiae]|uniref:Uncharacterized protein n=1 Tax=Glycomyces artemisiae TaxID=1076443 RepID=A0A2T0UE74_9ACTN|nr:hypothetical protein B0I28_11095 [Glycomyces artemisiae]
MICASSGLRAAATSSRWNAAFASVRESARSRGSTHAWSFSRSSGAAFAAARRAATGSSPARTSNRSAMSFGVGTVTMLPWPGTAVTRPSAASRWSASRSGMRETSNSAARSRSIRRAPGRSPTVTMRSRSAW